jgi:nucleoside-diphosphate-sugar epimerase
VYASTSEVVSGSYGSLSEHVDVTILNIHNPRWSYRIPKIASENYLVNSELPWLIFRYFNIYGSQSKPGHFVADQIIKIKKGIFEVVGGDETRSFCHVSDAIQASISCSLTTSREVINIGNDQEIRILDAASIIAMRLGHKAVHWTRKPSLPGSTLNRRPDITKLRTLITDYHPLSFERGIDEVLSNGDW